ncbi:hypothetical protein, partial [Verrucomicrobium spinosum]|uniref:hypothetical protein n=1 Tax=Verrucomicrobium spinosum TaxID=2736 RepID=UPI001C47AE58
PRLLYSRTSLKLTWPQDKGGGVSGPAVCGVGGAGRGSRDVWRVIGLGTPASFEVLSPLCLRAFV